MFVSVIGVYLSGATSNSHSNSRLLGLPTNIRLDFKANKLDSFQW
jgi:hypothetical protein